MGSIYAEDVVKNALSQVGYEEGSNNWNKYAKRLDSVNYFVGCGHKQNLPWCCVFANWCVFVSSDSSSDSGKKWDAINFQFQSSSCNTSAVVKYYKNFFKKKGRLYASNPQPGDIVFYGNDHCGVVISSSGSHMTVVEGNAGNKVKKLTRPISDGVFGRPYYDKKPAPTPTPTPTPDKKPYPGEWPVRPSRGYFQRYDKGPEVVKLQKLLLWTKPGCLPKYGADGDIGSETLQAVYDCQGIWGCKQDKFYGKDSEAAAKKYKK